MLRPPTKLLTAACLLVAVAACFGSPSARPAPPAAEFLLTTRDSTYWVTSDGTGIHVRGSPILLARFGGRFFEVYTADDDFSYADAVLLGQCIYRRDLESGDSAVVLVDTLVPRIARAYARSHPDEEPLGPDEETNDDPSTSATAEVDIGEIFGPFASYQYHADVALEAQAPWHTTRSGVIDLRAARSATLSDVFGGSVGARARVLGRSAYDSTRSAAVQIAADRGRAGARALLALERLRFDATSFMLTAVDREPAVIFDVPGTGQGAEGNVLELDPLPLPATGWWNSIRDGLPIMQHEISTWQRSAYDVLARYDSTGERAQLALGDRARHEWPFAVVGAPVERVDWLDHPPISAATRRALVRAFDAADTYDDNARLVSGPAPRHTPYPRHAQ